MAKFNWAEEVANDINNGRTSERMELQIMASIADSLQEIAESLKSIETSQNRLAGEI